MRPRWVFETTPVMVSLLEAIDDIKLPSGEIPTSKTSSFDRIAYRCAQYKVVGMLIEGDHKANSQYDRYDDRLYPT